MATLAYDLSDRTTVQVISPVRTSTAVDGTMRFIDLGSSQWSDINCVVEGLSDADRVTLMAFLDTNETGDIDVDINGVTYRGRLLPESVPAWEKNTGLNTVTFTLRAQAI